MEESAEEGVEVGGDGEAQRASAAVADSATSRGSLARSLPPRKPSYVDRSARWLVPFGAVLILGVSVLLLWS